MAFCPNCQAEYVEGHTRCPDCNVDLVAELPEESKEPREEWESVEPVRIHTAAAVIDAELIVASLRASGIRAFAKGTGAEVFTEAGGIGQMTRIPGPLNEIGIMVHPEDEAQAREILAEAESSTPEPEEAEAPQGGWLLDPVNRRRSLKIVAIIVLFPILYGVFVLLLDIFN